MKLSIVLRAVFIYYVKAVAFAAFSYGLLLLIYGQTKMSFFSWVLILLVAFTIGYIPSFVRLLRGNGS